MAMKPCSKGCGFFGDPEQRNLCSRCYRDEILSSVKASINSEKEKAQKAEPQEPSPISTVIEMKTLTKKTTKRCDTCKKKIGLMGFSCKCGGDFCSSHRFPEIHHCCFDFKSSGKDSIAKANPVVKADKLRKL